MSEPSPDEWAFIEWLGDPSDDPDAYVLVGGAWIEAGRVSIDARAKRRPSKIAPLPPRDDRLLTLAEASELIRTPSETIRFWIWQGKLVAFKPGRLVLIRESDLLAFVASRQK